MQVEIYSKDGQVTDGPISSVQVSETDFGCEIFINTVDKWLNYGYSGASMLYIGSKTTNEEKTRRHIGISIYTSSDVENNRNDQVFDVVIFPETEHENNLLSGIKYSHQEKDQIVFMIHPALDKKQTLLASFDSDSMKKMRQKI